MDAGDRTIRAYDERMARYLAADREPPQHVLDWQDRFAGLVGAGGTVLELGSGPGRDADHLEARGLRVLRSDATPAFVQHLRRLGHEVLTIDARTDPLPGGVDGVFANAVLLHLDRDALSAVLARIAGALRPGGVLACSLKEGDGDEWHDRKLGMPRHFTYWREDALRKALEVAGFAVLDVGHSRGEVDHWLHVLARTEPVFVS
jgi:SAM-dependent methyltransferase